MTPVDSIIGVLIQLWVGAYVPPHLMQTDGWSRPPQLGGHLNGDITLTITNNWKPKLAALIVIEGLADCMSPENIQVRDLEGRDVPFLIRDEQRDDKVRWWALVPKEEFRSIRVIVDIDFINKCNIT